MSGLSLPRAERLEACPPLVIQRPTADDLQRGAIGLPERVPVDEVAGGTPGAERGGQRLNVLAVAGGQRRVLGDVLRSAGRAGW